MILSHKHKFIFLRTQKTAGLSMEVALARICGPDDIITPIEPALERLKTSLGYPTRQNFVVPIKPKGMVKRFKQVLSKKTKPKTITLYNHVKASDLKRVLSAEIWNNYYKFSFERNPWDKMISWYWWAKKENHTMLEFLDFSNDLIRKGYDVYTIDGKTAVDKIYKFEELDAALADLSQRFNLKQPLQLPKQKFHSKSRKDKRHYREVLTGEEKSTIAGIFSKEIDLMGYEF